LYDSIIRKPVDGLSKFFGKTVEPKMIDGLVEGAGSMIQNAGEKLRLVQSGKIFAYATITVVGVIILLLMI
jgi:NADH-quinone oxidoreductase subunit L